MENKGYINQLIMQFSAAKEDLIAFSLYDGKQIKDVTYRQFAADILNAAGYFSKQNIKKQHIALIAPNSYDWIVTFFAITASGNVAVLLNPNLSKDFLQWQCEKADVSIICSDASVISELQPAIENMGWLTYDELSTTAPMLIDNIHIADPDETMLLMFTSGTTGKSKAVELTSENLRASINNILDLKKKAGLPGMEKEYGGTPMFHIGGLRSTIEALHQYRTICLGRGIKYMLMDMPVFNPTRVSFVPVTMETIVKIFKRTTAEERKKYIGNNVQKFCIGGAVLKTSIAQYLMSEGYVIEPVYGMTESAGDGIWCMLDEAHINALGKIGGDTQCRIQDGEILLKGAAIMKGYYKDPEETAKVIEDGWLHTGDMGYCDADGYYYITGRKKNVIILSNGENVNPEEIEAKWGNCEAILECMIYSDGKGICADIYTDNEIAAASFVKEYNESVPMYHQVYKVNYSATPLEKTGTGKIKRKENVYA